MFKIGNVRLYICKAWLEFTNRKFINTFEVSENLTKYQRMKKIQADMANLGDLLARLFNCQ